MVPLPKLRQKFASIAKPPSHAKGQTMRLLLLPAAFLLGGNAVFAAGSGDHSHAGAQDNGEHRYDMAIGWPGDPAEAHRTIEIVMTETDSGMHFVPGELDVQEGQTVRFLVKNMGALDHEIVIDTKENNLEHKAMMQKMPDMNHDDPNALRLGPGESGEIVWTFENIGTFQYACLLPGHMESGMHGPIEVN